MRYEAVINSYAFEEIPEKIKLEENTSLVVKDAKIIINTFDRNKDPICPAVDFDKGFTVGLKLDGERRVYKDEGGGTHSITREPDIYGEYVVLKDDAKINDVIEAVNGIIHNIKNTKSI